MGSPQSLRPIEVSKTTAREGSATKDRWVGTLGWLSLVGLAAAQPLSHATLAAGEQQPLARCQVTQKAQLFVGFAPGTGLESFEDSARSSGQILRFVKRWSCDEPSAAYVAPPSLQLALASEAGVRVDSIHFVKPDLTEARVSLSEAAGEPARMQWHIDLVQSGRSWSVERLATVPVSASVEE